MRSKKALSLLLSVIILGTSLSLLSCEKKLSRYTKTYFDYFDTVIELVGYTEDKDRFDLISKKAEELIASHHRLFDIYKAYDGICNLATVNASAGKAERTFAVDEALAELLEYGKEIYVLTNGKVNIAMGSVLSLWHERRAEGLDSPESASLPDNDALLRASEHTDIGAFKITYKDGAYMLTVSDSELLFDVGALAKGYTAKKAVALLRELYNSDGGESFMLNFGGMVCPISAKPDGEAWTAGIEYPKSRPSNDYLCVAALSSGALVTSSAEFRAYTVGGTSYGHIIDADTLFPPTYHASVSIYSDDPALADALSTALFCMSEQDGSVFIKKLASLGYEAEVMWLRNDATYSYTEGFSVIIKN